MYMSHHFDTIKMSNEWRQFQDRRIRSRSCM